MNIWDDHKVNFTYNGSNRPYWGKIASSIIVTLAIVLFIIYKRSELRHKRSERVQNRRYTIGITGNKFQNIKSPKPNVFYYYEVLSIQYKGDQDVDRQFESSVISNGGRYFVEYSGKDPANSVLLLDHPVPNDIISAPDSGWSLIPNERR